MGLFGNNNDQPTTDAVAPADPLDDLQVEEITGETPVETPEAPVEPEAPAEEPGPDLGPEPELDVEPAPEAPSEPEAPETVEETAEASDAPVEPENAPVADFPLPTPPNAVVDPTPAEEVAAAPDGEGRPGVIDGSGILTHTNQDVIDNFPKNDQGQVVIGEDGKIVGLADADQPTQQPGAPEAPLVQ